MPPRRQLRAFTLSAAASERVDSIHEIAAGQEDSERSYVVLRALGLVQTGAEDVDNCSLRPEDYAAIRTLTGVTLARTGVELIQAAAVPVHTRGALHALIAAAQRRNGRAAAVPPQINASRVADALILLGAAVVAAAITTSKTKVGVKPAPTVAQRRTPVTADNWKLAGYWPNATGHGKMYTAAELEKIRTELRLDKNGRAKPGIIKAAPVAGRRGGDSGRS